ncbi:MAG TPA: hypothetical protein PLI59_18205, partial [Candidatus Obscuribacter sp.]|nr:hypothetical protein [Candidatus Obscuribacter sp.]
GFQRIAYCSSDLVAMSGILTLTDTGNPNNAEGSGLVSHSYLLVPSSSSKKRFRAPSVTMVDAR